MRKFLSLLQTKETDWYSYINSLQPDGLHIDVMDGHAVNNLGVPLWVIPNLPKLPIHVHLMTNPTELFIDMVIDVKPELVFFHPKWSRDPAWVINQFQKSGIEVGIVWDDDSDEYFSMVKTILYMTVIPGKSGQSFLSSRLEKIRHLSCKYSEHKIWLDGGINQKSLQLISSEPYSVEGVVIGSSAREVF